MFTPKSNSGPTIYMAEGSTLNWQPKVYNISEPQTFKIPEPPEELEEPEEPEEPSERGP